MIEFDEYLEKFSENGQHILQKAVSSASAGNKSLTEGHLVLVLLEEHPQFFDSLRISNELTLEFILESVNKQIKQTPLYQGKGFKIERSASELFKRAMTKPARSESKTIDAIDLLQAVSYFQPKTHSQLEPSLLKTIKYFFNFVFGYK